VGAAKSPEVGDGILLGVGERVLVGVGDGILLGVGDEVLAKVGDGTLVAVGNGELAGVGDAKPVAVALRRVCGTAVLSQETNSPTNTKAGTKQILKSQFKRVIICHGL
jgi:hypothetical protein